MQENKIQEPTADKNVDNKENKVSIENKILKQSKVSTESKFSKEQLLGAKCFEGRTDIVDALLVQGK